MYFDVEATFSWKSRNSECIQPSKIVSMGWKSSKNRFKMIQKHLQFILNSTAIIFDHFNNVKAKVDWDEPVQVVRMVIWCIIYFSMDHITILTTWTGSPRSTFAVTWSEWSHMITELSNITCRCFWIIWNHFFEDFQPIEMIFEDLLYSEFRDFHENIASTSKYNE